MSEALGLDRKTALEKLGELSSEKTEVEQQLRDLGVDPFKSVIPPTSSIGKYAELVARLEGVTETIDSVREWYAVNVLESLGNSTRRLEWLTAALIGLTIALTVLTGWLVLRA